MPCRCEKCGEPTACGEEYCEQCFIEECCKTDTEKNMFVGGRFYDEEFKQKAKDGSLDKFQKL